MLLSHKTLRLPLKTKHPSPYTHGMAWVKKLRYSENRQGLEGWSTGEEKRLCEEAKGSSGGGEELINGERKRDRNGEGR